jgi:hypothetical protein
MSAAGRPNATPLPRRAALALLAGGAVAHPARAAPALSDSPVLLVAGPEGGRLARWGAVLAEALEPGLPPGTRLRPVQVGGADGVTGANQFATRAAPDGNTLLLAPGDAALAWAVGDPRARFDAAQWTGVLAATMPCMVCGRATAPGARLRVGMSGPVGHDLVALLGLELAGLATTPVYGVLDQAAAAQALGSHAVDAVLLRGDTLPDTFGRLAQHGAMPLFTLGDLAGQGHDPLLPNVPNLVEFAAHRAVVPHPDLLAAWRGIAAATQADCALVLPHLTPAALVALWRQAAVMATASPAVHEVAGASRVAPDPAAQGLAQALAPDVPALAALRAWLAAQLGWKPA